MIFLSILILLTIVSLCAWVYGQYVADDIRNYGIIGFFSIIILGWGLGALVIPIRTRTVEQGKCNFDYIETGEYVILTEKNFHKGYEIFRDIRYLNAIKEGKYYLVKKTNLYGGDSYGINVNCD